MPRHRASVNIPAGPNESPTPEEQDALSPFDLTTANPEDLAIWIAAAELRIVTDRRLGKVTPKWVEQLARAKG